MRLRLYIPTAQTIVVPNAATALQRLTHHLMADAPLAYDTYLTAAADAQERMPYYEPDAPWSRYFMHVVEIEIDDCVTIQSSSTTERSAHLAARVAHGADAPDVLWLPDHSTLPGNCFRIVATRNLAPHLTMVRDISVLPVPAPTSP
ncbi:MAG: hypothetical protein JWR63_187 [Conexibacter sp.]|nr:hypothetical protein [Conexibacter sp.]